MMKTKSSGAVNLGRPTVSFRRCPKRSHTIVQTGPAGGPAEACATGPLAVSLGFEGKDSPSHPAFLDKSRPNRLPHKQRDSPLPKMPRRSVRLHHAHLPASREPPPDLMRRARSNSPPPASPHDEKLSHVPHRFMAGIRGSRLDQHQPGQFPIYPDQERMPARISPIERQRLISELAVLPYIYMVEFAEIVRVQLEQLRQDRLLFRRSRDQFKTRGCQVRIIADPGFRLL